MLGKTHVTNTLAVVNASILSLVVLKGYTGSDSTISVQEPIEVLGTAITGSMSLLEFSMVFLTVLVFSLFILRVGKNHNLRLGYFSLFLVFVFVLWFGSDTTYPFIITMLMMLLIFGTLLPDIDSPKSLLGRYIKPISEIIPHRTITHTVWVVLLFFIVSYYFQNIYVAALGLGYTLHIVQDSFSVMGIYWLYPIKIKGRKNGISKALTYTVGSAGESVIFGFSLAILFVSIVFTVRFILKI